MVQRPDLTIRQVSNAESETVISVSGELDMSTIDTLVAHVDAALVGPVDGLTLDLQELAFMDSSGLRLLIELNDRARSEGWRLKLIGPEHPAASRVLQITGADVALPFEPGTV
ncbi:MAG: STAS domain-containing protein [Solirubrobacteraceae bacterium]